MPIFDDVSALMKEALRAKQQTRLAALRSIRAGFLNDFLLETAPMNTKLFEFDCSIWANLSFIPVFHIKIPNNRIRIL